MKKSKNPRSLMLEPARAKNIKLVFFGNERLATGVSTNTPVLKALVAASYDVVAVIANQNQARSRKKRDLEIVGTAKDLGIPVYLPNRLGAIRSVLQKLQPEAAVLVAYGNLIPQDIIKIFPKGIINIHPSLLPVYRGPTPIEQTILDGLTHTGTSLMKLTALMDEGPVYSQASLDITGNETKQELADKLLELGNKLLIQKLPDILDRSLEPRTQGSAKAIYTKPLLKTDGLINWQLSANIIERQVRAYEGWPKSRAKVHGHDVIITKARVAKDENDGNLVIRANPGWLEIKELIAPSGRKITGADFLRGYRK